MVCPNCRTQNALGARYCLSCGAILTGETQAAEPPGAPPWTPYPALNTPTTPPGSQQQPNAYPAYTPYPEQPAPAQFEGATWPGTQPPHGPGGPIPPGSQRQRGSGWQTVASIVAVGVVLAGMMFVWLSRGQHSTPPANATATPRLVSATATATATATPVPTACRNISNFIGASTATITPMFPEDVPFPPASLSYLGQTYSDGPYTYYLVQVCSSGVLADGARAFFARTLPQSGWAQSPYFPYRGNPSSDCGDPYCWQSGGSPARYISLEQAQTVDNGAAATYVLRLAVYTG